MRLEHGQPVRFGKDGQKAVCRRPDGVLHVVDDVENSTDEVWIHDAHASEPSTAFALSRLADTATLANTAIGVFRDVERPVYDRQLADQLTRAQAHGQGDLQALLQGKDTWKIG
jgi:2-oxoglutarate/2-oxoacid ferredoxin oxidoreductase subunit beta